MFVYISYFERSGVMDEFKPQETGKKLQLEPRMIKYGILYAAIVFVVALGTLGIAANNTLNYKNIYSGVYVEDIDLSSQPKETAIQEIKSKYNNLLEGKEIQIVCKNQTKKVVLNKLGTYYDVDSAVEDAFKVARTGNPIKRLLTISKIKNKHHVIKLSIHVDREKLQEYVKELNAQLDNPAKEYSYAIEGDKLKVVNGVPGDGINTEKAIALVISAINQGDAAVNLPTEIVKPKSVSVEDLSTKVFSEPVDASYEVKNHRLKIIPEVKGKKFDLEEAKRQIEQHKADGQQFYIPLIYTNPKVYSNQLESSFFKDVMATYTTNFNAGYVERTHNVALAASKINNVVLGVGDVFSYNNVVGPRSDSTGFKKAKVFVGGEIVDGMGGGICQVSSTLYNAVLLADLDIVKRLNHSMVVSYVPEGQDATVADGAIDFLFKNNTKAPLKLISTIKGSRLIFEIYGTNPEPGKVVEIRNNIVSTTPFEVKRKDDSSLPEGKVVVEQKGVKGCVADVYKIIKRNGVEESKQHIARSRYMPTPQIEIRGTKKIAVPTPIPEESVIQEPQVPQGNSQPIQQPDVQPEPMEPAEQITPAENTPPPEV